MRALHSDGPLLPQSEGQSVDLDLRGLGDGLPLPHFTSDEGAGLLGRHLHRLDRHAGQAGGVVGVARIFAVAARRRACTVSGVLTGVPMLHHVLETMPGMPSSAKVGTSGRRPDTRFSTESR